MKKLIIAFVLLLPMSGTAQDLGAGIEALDKGDYAKALELLKPLAEQGDSDAQMQIGFMYMDGTGVPQDFEVGIEWMRRSADQGNASSQGILGDIFLNGDGVSQDDNEAAEWYRKSAEQGLSIAQYKLGYMYANGKGVQQDDIQAVAWFLKAANAGNVDAKKYLEYLYASGRGAPKNDTEVFEGYLREAADGDANAQLMVGEKYYYGKGVSKNLAEAFIWYLKAANQDLTIAQHLVGFMYANGIGVPQNDKEAFRWLRTAADKGHADSQAKLSYLYYQGKGVAQSFVLAHMYINLAAAQGYDDAAMLRDGMARKMTSDQISRAQQLASEFDSTSRNRYSANAPQKISPKAYGTCFGISPDGLLLTSHHVVEGGTSIKIELADGRLMDAVVQSDSVSTDLAVLRVDATGLAFLPLSKMRSAQVGMDVFTIGYPATDILGGDPKFTDGTISSLSGIKGDSTLLQITVPIQPGNSGGPLVNSSGEEVGIVTSTAAAENFFSQTGTLPQNVNWAVKSDYARLLLDDVGVLDATNSRGEALDRTMRAVCKVLVY